MIRVWTGSRLHFGLINAGNLPDTPRFGGLGLMIAHPRVVVRVAPANVWSAEGPHAERALKAAQSTAASCGVDDAFHVVVEECPPAHTGLGVGTQLALASGMALGLALEQTVAPAAVATALGRGKRSAIGVEGFSHGGFIVDAGKSDRDLLGQTQRFDWPADWKIVLARPHTATTWHGGSELEAFARPRDLSKSIRIAGHLRHLATDVIAPALWQADYSTFGLTLFEYNRAAGEAFAEDQGGVYSSPEVEALVGWIRNRGIPGVGQSSWGPTVFAICSSQGEADRIAAELKTVFFNLDHVSVTSASNAGFRYEASS